MASTERPYRPYAGKPAPTALQIIDDCNVRGKFAHKTILITGCSSGIGVEIARALYETGAKLLLTARDMPKLERVIEDITSCSSAKYPRPEAIELHLDSLASVRSAASVITPKCDSKLDILINNAGVAALPYTLTADNFESHFGTNHLGPFLLFNLLRSSLPPSSRVINVSSGGHVLSDIRYSDIHFRTTPYNKFQAYAQSKTANILMAKYISSHLNMISLAVHPGEVDTPLYRHMSDEDYGLIGNKERFQSSLVSPEKGAATVVWAAVSEYFEDVSKGGQFLADCGEGWVYQGKEAVAAYAMDAENAERLWRVNCEEVGVDIE